MSTEMKTLRGLSIRVGLFGPEDAARTMLCFNGIGARLEAVESFGAHMPDTRVVTFDVPGVGESPAPLAPYRPALIAAMAADLLDDLGLEQVDVFGVSWGGAIAQQFAHDHQARCKTLTLAATSAGMIMVPGNPRALLKMVTPKRYTDPNYMVSIAPAIYGHALDTNLAIFEEFAQMVMGGSKRGYFYQLLAGYGWASWLWLPQIKVPTLILMGAYDNIVPVINGQILHARLPNATLQILECGHMFILTKPEATAAAIHDFLRAH